MAKPAKKPKPKTAHGNKSGTKRPAAAKGSVKPAAKKAPAPKKLAPASRIKAARPSAAKKPTPKPIPKPAAKPLPKSVAKSQPAAPVGAKPPLGKAPLGKPPVGKLPAGKLAPMPAPRPEFPPAPPPTPSPKPVFVPPPRPPEAPRPTPIKLKPPTGPNAARILTVRAMLDAQRKHDLPGLLALLAPEPTLEFVGGPRHVGKERVGQIYGDMMRAFPDLTIDVVGEHAGERSVIVEFVLQGTHRQQWLGMAPRGRTLTLPVCAVFLFDKKDQLANQRLYLDRNLAIVQLTSGLLR
jgi:steroid delta-isomerase-like uncharacterized protein